MSTPTLCHTLRLELPVVTEWLGRKISALLQREIHCEATVDDYDYWALKCTNDRFSLADLSLLLAHVKASREVAIQAIPSDADSTCGIDLLLSNELLKEVLNTGWEQQLVYDTTLYLIGVSREALTFPYSSPDIFQIGSLTVQRNLLFSKDEFLHKLHEGGDCYSTLASLSARYVDLFKNELHWHYPISDDRHTGLYFILVQEGVLCLPYDYVTQDDFELFEPDAAHLCTAEEMQVYLDDWERQASYLTETMRSLQANLIFREVIHGKKD
jgi:hypothetical protein